MKQNGSPPTRDQRLDTITNKLRELREADTKRRRDAGPQQAHDHDHSGSAMVADMRRVLNHKP